MEAKKKMVSEIRYMAKLLEPYIDIDIVLNNANGISKHVPIGTAEYIAVVRAWWSSLLAMAELIDGQKEIVTGAQKDYILRELCGAMGSFSDFQLDANISGTKASKTNQKLNKARKKLYDILVFPSN